MTDKTIPYGAPGIAGFDSETWGGPAEFLYGDTPPLASQSHTVTGGVGGTKLAFLSVVDALGALAVFTPGVMASGTITLSVAVPTAGETVTIAGIEYTFADAAAAPYEVTIGATLNDTAANLAAAINAGAGSGTVYGAGTLANEFVTASVASAVVTVTAKVVGTGGNAITLAETGDNIAVSGATLANGTAATSNAYGILATAVDIPAGVSAQVPLYKAGHFDGNALVWGASFDTPGKQKVAFEGTKTPSILVSHKKFSDNDLAI